MYLNFSFDSNLKAYFLIDLIRLTFVSTVYIQPFMGGRVEKY